MRFLIGPRLSLVHGIVLCAVLGSGLAPTKTWDELIEISRKVTKASGMPHGFVFQGVLEGEMTGAEAAEVLDKDLRAIVIRNR